MNTKRVALGLTVAYLATMVLVAFVPAASAQTGPKLQISANGNPTPSANIKDGGRLKPEAEFATVEFPFKVTVPQSGGCIFPIIVTYDVKPVGQSASWSTVIKNTGQQTIPFKSTGAGGTPLAGQNSEDVPGFSVVMTVSTTREAPAFADGSYQVTAVAKSGGSTQQGCYFTDSDPLTIPTTIKNDYIARMTYEPSAYIQKTGQNKKIAFSITMVNLGNGATKVDTAVDQTSKSKLDAVIPPVQQLILSKAQNAQNKNTAETVITVQTPHSNGYTNTFYSLKATFTAASDNTVAQNLVADVKSLNLSVQVQGVYVPGFDPSMAIAGLGIALLMLGILRRQAA